MIGDVSLLSGHVVTSLSRFVAFLLSVGVRSQDVELFAAWAQQFKLVACLWVFVIYYELLGWLNNALQSPAGKTGLLLVLQWEPFAILQIIAVPATLMVTQ